MGHRCIEQGRFLKSERLRMLLSGICQQSDGVGGHMLVVALTFADHDGRYLLYILPLIATLAACGVVSLRGERDFGLSFRDA